MHISPKSLNAKEENGVMASISYHAIGSDGEFTVHVLSSGGIA
jgi:hypothetical protein